MKSLVRRSLRGIGYELRRYAPTSSERALLEKIIAHHRIDLVFDIGANRGGFGAYLRDLGYLGKIVSFEPMKSAHSALEDRARRDALWTVADQCALGDHDGEVELNVAGNSESSSLLDMQPAHQRAAPASAYVKRETVPLRTLDAVAHRYLGMGANVFLKIDTQGYEDRVLSGALDTLRFAKLVQIELSLVELYVGQKLMPEMIALMQGHGFDLWALAPVFADPLSGRVLQMDGLFSSAR